MKKLIKMIQKAHGAEIGAIHAYWGHWNSLPVDSADAKRLREIIHDEFDHKEILESLLRRYNKKPSNFYDNFYFVVGHVLGKLCKVMGYRIPMKVARTMETMGTIGYGKMGYHAYIIGHIDLYNIFMDMAKVESEHEQWFADVLKKR